MSNKPRGSRIPISPIMCTNSIRRDMALNKPHVHGMTELLQDRGFEVGQINPTLFTKKVKGELFVCQLYFDDIIFGSPNKAFNEEFAALMTSKFKMSLMGELKFFLGF